MRNRFLFSRIINVLLLFSLIFPGTIVPLYAQDEAETPFVDAPIAADLQAAAADAAFTINVNTLVDEWSTDTNTKASSKCSLREALQATVSGNPQGNQGCGAASIGNFSEYDINLIPGTYLLTLNEQLPNILKKVVINGNGAVTIDGKGNSGRAHGIFIVGSGELILQKLKLQHGLRPFGGAVWIKGGGTVRVTEVEFFQNVADNGGGNGDGGAVAVDSGAFYCVKSKFQENTARQSGGAISSGGVQVLLDRCEFFRNHAELNGGAYAGYGGSETTHPIIRDSKFRENWVYQTNVPANWPSQYQFTDDQSGGGAIYNKGYMEIERTEIFKNYTQRSKGGGAIYNQGDLRLLDMAISDNKARIDGPVQNTLGGAILNDSTLIIRRTSIHNNEAKFGGAILNRTGGKLWLINSTVAENLAITGGGIENGHNFLMNGGAAINQGGEINIWHSTVVRANANNPGASVANNGNGSVYMANSIMDTACYGWLGSWGGNIFKEPCQRVSADNSVDLTLKDVVVKNVDEIKLEGLANNGGPNLPDAEFLSIKVSGGSPALDLGEDDYCIDPAIQPLFLVKSDQIQGQRPQGPKCDAGALEVGSLPPQFESDQPEGAGFHFPLTIFGKVWSSTQTLTIKNKGGGSIAWSMMIENSAGGTYTLESGPVSGGLGRNQSQTLTFKCTPTNMGWNEGMILIKTDLPDKPEIRYPISCKMITNPEDPSTLRSQPPGPISTGSTAPSGTAKTQLAINNQGAKPMAATVNLKDALAQTIKFIVNLGSVNAAGTAANVTVPPGGEMKIDITCTPSEAGLFYNTLVITTDDPVDPLLEYDISCEGVTPLAPEPLAMGNNYAELPQHQIMGMALRPDGKQLLAGHWDNNEMAVYSIADLASGNPNLQSKFSQPNMNTITGIRYSSDGNYVYYSSLGGNGVGVANVKADGTLSATQVITTGSIYICGVISGGNFPLFKFCPIDAMKGARALDISPDDQNLYVAGNSDDTLTVLQRNPDNGMLYFTQKFTRTIEGVDLLDGAFGVLASDDGKNVYVAARDDDALVVFSRSSNGTLRYLAHHRNGENGVAALDGPIEIAISPDGKFLYVVSLNSDAVQIFERNPSDGYLTPVESMAVGDGPYHVAISHDPEGSRLLVALWTGDGVKAYARDLTTGKLSTIPNQADLAMDGAVYLLSSKDDQNVYVGLFDGKSVQQLRSQHRVPVVQNISPASVKSGGGNFTLTVNGAAFYETSTILWNGAGLATTFVSDRQLKATVPAALIGSAGSANIVVHTGPLGGGDSKAQSLSITAPNAEQTPSVESLSPAAANYGGEALNVIVNGAGFVPTSQALLNGSPVKTTYVSGVMLLAELAATDVGEPGPLVISVVNGAAAAEVVAAEVDATKTSKPVKFSVAPANTPAQATISGFQPASIQAGSGEQWITVKGYSFSTLADASSVATWNGEARETVVQDDNTILLHLSAADVAVAGKPKVTVQTPGVPESDPKNFTVLSAGQNPVAQMTSLYVDMSGSLQLVVSGSDFVSGAQIRINGVAKPTTVVNAYVVTAAVSYADLQKGGLIQVANPNAAASNGQILMAQRFIFLPMITK